MNTRTTWLLALALLAGIAAWLVLRHSDQQVEQDSQGLAPPEQASLEVGAEVDGLIHLPLDPGAYARLDDSPAVAEAPPSDEPAIAEEVESTDWASKYVGLTRNEIEVELLKRNQECATAFVELSNRLFESGRGIAVAEEEAYVGEDELGKDHSTVILAEGTSYHSISMTREDSPSAFALKDEVAWLTQRSDALVNEAFSGLEDQ